MKSLKNGLANYKYMTWQQRYKRMKKGMGWTNTDIAEITGNTKDSIKSSTQPNGCFPRMLKIAIIVFEKKEGL